MLAGRHREGGHGHQVQRQDQSQPEEGGALQLEGEGGKQNSRYLDTRYWINICTENWENSGQVFEEERHQRRRSEEGDVGP